jgi:hypothetical protein
MNTAQEVIDCWHEKLNRIENVIKKDDGTVYILMEEGDQFTIPLEDAPKLLEYCQARKKIHEACIRNIDKRLKKAEYDDEEESDTDFSF